MATKRELNRIAREIFNSEVKTLAPGQTTHVNHTGCPGGDDTRRRLYFTRKDVPSSVVVWYCHNCGEGGAITNHKKARNTDCSMTAGKGDLDHILEVINRSVDLMEEPPLSMKQRHWLYGTCDVTYPRGFVLWDPVDESLVFPINVASEEQQVMPFPLAMQKRYHSDYGPKNITVKAHERVKVRRFVYSGEGRERPVVVVEDALSGFRVAYDSKHDAYVLHGSHMDITELVEHKERFKHGVIVWLDNDNDQVLKSAAAIVQRARALGYPAEAITAPTKEPKKCLPGTVRLAIEQATGEYR